MIGLLLIHVFTSNHYIEFIDITKVEVKPKIWNRSI